MGQIIALDSMIFIYFFDLDARYSKVVDELFSQVESGKVSALTSIISAVETLSPQKYAADIALQTKISHFFLHAPNLLVQPVNWEISLEAARLRRENHFLKTPDSLQLATAIVGQVNSFVTYDAKLFKMKLPFKVISVQDLPRTGKAIRN